MSQTCFLHTSCLSLLFFFLFPIQGAERGRREKSNGSEHAGGGECPCQSANRGNYLSCPFGWPASLDCKGAASDISMPGTLMRGKLFLTKEVQFLTITVQPFCKLGFCLIWRGNFQKPKRVKQTNKFFITFFAFHRYQVYILVLLWKNLGWRSQFSPEPSFA